MVVAFNSDVLIDYLRGRSPWAERIRLEIETGELTTTAVNSFELLSGAKRASNRDKVTHLLDALTVLGISAEAGERAAEARLLLEKDGLGIGMADYLIAGVCLANGGILLTRNLSHFERVPGLKISGRYP